MLEIKPLFGLVLDFPQTNLDFLHTNLVPSSIYNEVDSRFLKEHHGLASTCPWSNLSPVYGTSIKRKIGIRGAITYKREKQLPISNLALKLGYINRTNTHIHKVELKSLYFTFVWLLQNRVFSSLSRENEKLLKSQRFTHR